MARPGPSIKTNLYAQHIDISRIASERGDAILFEELICSLLSRSEGQGAHLTDGLLIRYDRANGSRRVIGGMVIYIESQSVEPFRMEFGFAKNDAVVTRGRISIGFSDKRAAPYGTCQHSRLENHFLANPEGKFDWREAFVYSAAGWREILRKSLSGER